MQEEEKDNNRSIEQLSHFSCKSCGKWWTIGDAPGERPDWFCPWCGEPNSYVQ